MEVEIVNDGPVTVQLEFTNAEKSVSINSDECGEVDTNI